MDPNKIKTVQKLLHQHSIDGWLIYDFRGQNDVVADLLERKEDGILSRRYFYWIPASGEPIKIVHQIEQLSLQSLPGRTITYSTWQELEERLKSVLDQQKRIAMEYSPRNAIPYISKVDAGTLEVVKTTGVEIISSADLLQNFTSIWTDEQYQMHIEAAQVLDDAAKDTWQFIFKAVRDKQRITEYDVQQHILKFMHQRRCVTDDLPNCSVNENSANPHYCPDRKNAKTIQHGDFVLIDLWCKKDHANAVYADITRVGVADSKPTPKQQEIFDIVKKARDAATDLVRTYVERGQPLCGWEVDQAARNVIAETGYGKYFIHRTGHNIDKQVHGAGAHIDNFETQDHRKLIPRTCFSIEPGIYLPGQFGVRLEYDIFIHDNQRISISGGIQEKLACF